VLVAVILGGTGSIYGVVVGGILVALIPEAFRAVPNYRYIALGVILVVMVLVRPEGLIPAKRRPQRHDEEAMKRARACTGLLRDSPLPSLIVEGLSVKYGGVVALDGVSVSFEAGRAQVLGIIGPNGAGKTTLLDAMTGFTSGRCRLYSVGGQCQRLGRPVQVARLGMRRTFQTSRLFGELTAFENVYVAVESTMRSRSEARKRAEEALIKVGLAEDWWKQRALSLPYGSQRLVEVARALVGGSCILLLDEPTTGLNDSERKEMAQVIERIRNLNRHVLLIDHDVHFITSVCDSVIALNYGREIANGPSATVLANAIVREAYLGE